MSNNSTTGPTHLSQVPTEVLRKDALSENQITEIATDISRAGAKGGHSWAVIT